MDLSDRQGDFSPKNTLKRQLIQCQIKIECKDRKHSSKNQTQLSRRHWCTTIYSLMLYDKMILFDISWPHCPTVAFLIISIQFVTINPTVAMAIS